MFNIVAMKNPIEQIIDLAGSPMAAANLLSVTPQQVTNWRKRGMPADARIKALEDGFPLSMIVPNRKRVRLFPKCKQVKE